MIDQIEWRVRLAEVIRDRGETPHSVSLKAGMAKGYVSQALQGRDMTIGNLYKICAVLSITPTQILEGFPLDAEVRGFLDAWQRLPEASKQAFRLLAGIE